jgi:hypothetical protein
MSGREERAPGGPVVLAARPAPRDPGLAAAPARPANVVVLALVAALLDLELRQNRGKVRPPMDCDLPA